MHELARCWRVLAIRGLLALAFAFLAPFGTGLLKYPLLQAVTVPFLITAFAVYVLLDSLLLFVLANQFSRPFALRNLLLLQSIFSISIAIALFTLFFKSATLQWFVVLSICQSGLTGIFELLASTHFRRHLEDEYATLAAGIVSLLFCVALLLLQNGEIGRAFRWIVSYAAFFGASMLWFSLRLRSILRTLPAADSVQIPAV
jgi:hypothetical protein